MLEGKHLKAKYTSAATEGRQALPRFSKCGSKTEIISKLECLLKTSVEYFAVQLWTFANGTPTKKSDLANQVKLSKLRKNKSLLKGFFVIFCSPQSSLNLDDISHKFATEIGTKTVDKCSWFPDRTFYQQHTSTSFSHQCFTWVA